MIRSKLSKAIGIAITGKCSRPSCETWHRLLVGNAVKDGKRKWYSRSHMLIPTARGKTVLTQVDRGFYSAMLTQPVLPVSIGLSRAASDWLVHLLGEA